tara:strand:+ start:20 stop:403 length:384 start_codon:yes stop_codon:yes gene_type:complete
MIIEPAKKIIIKESPGKGLGVFATDKIKQGEIIEVCPLFDIKADHGHTFMVDYHFNYPKYQPKTFVITWGYGCLYNHSDTPNADWIEHQTEFAFIFYSMRDIQPEEEICTFYGDEKYWGKRPHIEKI